jgi:hypothetical protein
MGVFSGFISTDQTSPGDAQVSTEFVTTGSLAIFTELYAKSDASDRQMRAHLLVERSTVVTALVAG